MKATCSNSSIAAARLNSLSIVSYPVLYIGKAVSQFACLALYRPQADSNDARKALPLLLWRRGSGRGGPSLFSMPRFAVAFRRVTASTYLACWRGTTTSSPWPSPPEEEREIAKYAH